MGPLVDGNLLFVCYVLEQGAKGLLLLSYQFYNVTCHTSRGTGRLMP